MNLSELIKRIIYNGSSMNLYNKHHLELVKKIHGRYYNEKQEYEKMYRYYKGDTDALRKYTFLTKRSNNKISANYLKKFIKEEVAYTVGNPITYESRSGDENIITDVTYLTSTWSKNHEADVMKYLLIFSKIYELYYFDNGVFKSKIIKPTDGYAYCDSNGNVLFFIHSFGNDFDSDTYIDVYTDKYIYHFNSKFEEVKPVTTHLFRKVPVSIGSLSEEGREDSLYNDIKGVQDAFETNFSDSSNEMSDFRNAYLKFLGCKVEEADLEKMKELGILQSNTKDANIDWLIKNINDTFVQNTLDREIDLMYQIACHINHNEKLQSNVSGITLRSRLIALENKCTLLIGCHYDIIMSRISFICDYLNIKGKNYNYLDVKVRYTPNIPQDDLGMAQILSQVPEGIISKHTGRTQFSFISNPTSEAEKVKKELEDEIGVMDDLDGDFDE
ncbi:MAG: phage portal protein [Sarcina sp.]